MSELYRNGTIHTMDPGGPTTVDAVLVDGGRFVAIGEEAVRLGSLSTAVDLGGVSVVPGLIDAHAHLETDAMSHARWIDIRDVPVEELLERLRRHAATLPAGTWIVGQATFGQDKALLDRHVLDAACPDHPVIVRASMHAMSANTRALDAAGLMVRGKHVPTPTVVRRGADGLPSGQLLEAHHLFPLDLPSADEHANIIEEEIRERFNRYGVTTVYEVPMSREGIRAFQRLERTGRLTARISINPAIRPGLQPIVDDIADLAATGFMTGFGNDRLWFGAAKYFLDSVYEESFSAARDVEHPAKWGVLTHGYSEVLRALLIGYEAGIQIWFHALGEGAQRLVLDASTEAQAIAGGDSGLRTRVEHIFNDDLGSPEVFERLRAANVIPVPNGVFMHFYGPDGGFPYRSLIEQGFMPPGNSDNSGTQPFADNPWFGISKLCTRRNKFDELIAPQEAVGVHDAIRTYTEFAAHAGHKEGQLGVIRAGAHADFSVLSADPYGIPVEELEDIRSRVTYLAGTAVWES